MLMGYATSLGKYLHIKRKDLLCIKHSWNPHPEEGDPIIYGHPKFGMPVYVLLIKDAYLETFGHLLHPDEVGGMKRTHPGDNESEKGEDSSDEGTHSTSKGGKIWGISGSRREARSTSLCER
jgi:hypothetical protein